MRKTTIEIDDELVKQAGEVLGTRGLKATVHGALEEIVKRQLRERFIRRMTTMEGLDLDNEEVMARAWR